MHWDFYAVPVCLCGLPRGLRYEDLCPHGRSPGAPGSPLTCGAFLPALYPPRRPFGLWSLLFLFYSSVSLSVPCHFSFQKKKKIQSHSFAYYCRDIFQSFEFHESEIPTSHEADLLGGACSWVKPRLCSWDAWILLLSSQTGGSLSRDLCAVLGCVRQSGIAQLFCFQISGNGIFFTSLIFW